MGLQATFGESYFCYKYHGCGPQIGEGIRPAAQPLLVEYARNVGPPLRGSNEGSSTKEPPLFIVSPPLSPLRCGVDAWILAQGRPPINKKSQRLWPVVRERTA